MYKIIKLLDDTVIMEKKKRKRKFQSKISFNNFFKLKY